MNLCFFNIVYKEKTLSLPSSFNYKFLITFIYEKNNDFLSDNTKFYFMCV